MPTARRRIEVFGVVQGVGFRPFVYRLAREHGLAGSVHNHSSGVTIEAEGAPESLERFARDLTARLPAPGSIDRLTVSEIEPRGETDFRIAASAAGAARSTPVPADIATCADCLRELNDPADRRFGYPFLNCTHCGPRFTIVRDLPYDRPATTMAAFALCAACEAEYRDPANRRFHAQPTACPVCGPTLSHPVEQARAWLDAGLIVAVKGIGGFHLACDATSDAAVSRLRERKHRFEQPFAVMARDLAAVCGFAEVSGEEAALLESPQRPIVLLRKRERSHVLSHAVAPGNGYVGAMLPYSPLHHLLLGEKPLVMTSANPSGQPIVRENEEARTRLAAIADVFLTHNRDIEVVCDDSVVRVFEGHEMPIRRSRGYAPLPVRLPRAVPGILAVGAELKSAFCITKDDCAYLSQHIGDMGTLETWRAFERALDHMLRLFRVEPAQVVCDRHPGYLSSHWAADYAARRGIPLLAVQHHHAHVASLVAEAGLPLETPVLGIAFDGTGYGLSEANQPAIWGGEALLVEGRNFRRFRHLREIPLAGGDASVRTPARTALCHLRAAGIAWDRDLPCVSHFTATELALLDRQLERRLNCVETSSMGRLFDAVAALLGIRQTVSYEGQAAIELESAAAASRGRAYPLPLDPAPLLRSVIEDLRAGIPRAEISAAFHETIALRIAQTAREARLETGLNRVALTGGVFQNLMLLRRAVQLLRAERFEVLVHRIVPANDGGLALGQAALAAAPV